MTGIKELSPKAEGLEPGREGQRGWVVSVGKAFVVFGYQGSDQPWDLLCDLSAMAD